MKSLINWLAVIALLLIFGSNSNAQTVTLVGDVSGAIGSEHTIELRTSDLTGLGIRALDITDLRFLSTQQMKVQLYPTQTPHSSGITSPGVRISR